MRMISILAATVGICSISPVFAQAPQPAPLSLQEVVSIALRNQVDIRVAQNNVTASAARRSQARADYLPQVTIQNNAFTIGSDGVLTERRTGTALVATQNIFDAGLREARVAAARYNVTGSQADLARTVQAVTFDVTTAYYDMLRAKHLADVAQADVRLNEANREVIQARIDVGDAARVDVLPVEAQLANARVNLVAAQNALRVSAIQLQNAMGLAPQPGFDIQDVTATPTPEIRPVETYVATAMASRPDVAGAQADVGAARAITRTTRIALYPRPQISAEYQRGFGGLEGDSSQIFGGVVFNIFSGGANQAAFKEARANQASAEQRNLQVGKDIQAQVQSAYFNLNDSKERLAASQVGLEAAQQNYEVQQARYRQGLAIPLDLLNAELQLITAQTNVIQARYDLYTAIAQMDFAVGRDGNVDAT